MKLQYLNAAMLRFKKKKEKVTNNKLNCKSRICSSLIECSSVA